MNAVEWVPLTRDAVTVGDLVSTDAGGMPIYRVVAVDADQAWVQEAQHPAVQMCTRAFHWKAREHH